MKDIKNGLLYDTDTSEKVATNIYWDGSNWDRNGRSTTLYKTENGRFFLYHQTRWQGERDRIEPIDQAEAKIWYEDLPEWEMDYKDAFGIEPEKA